MTNQSPSTSTAAPPPAVLAVDDRIENLAALREALKDMELRLLEATSGREALGVLLRERPAVVLMDVNMPGMDGFETARLIRGNPETSALPIIFLTASDPDSSLTFTGYAAGAVDYLHKPINSAVLRSKVRVFLDLRRQQDALEDALAELADLNQNLERRAEERAAALRESERRFSVVMQQSPVGMAVVSLEREWLEVNEELRRMLGRERGEMLGRRVDEFIHESDLAEARKRSAEMLAGRTRGYEHEKRLVHKDGFSIWVRASASVIRGEEDEPRYFVAQYRDVTEAKLVREATRCVATELVELSGERYLEAAACRVAEILDAEIGFVAEPAPDAPGAVRTVALVESGEVQERLSYSLTGTPCAEVVRAGSCIVREGLQGRYPENEYLRGVGAEAYAALSFTDPDGEFLGHVGVIGARPFSVSSEGIERVLSVFTQALTATLVKEHERERFVRLFDLAPDALIEVDHQGLIRMVNRTAEEVFGWPRDELTGRPIETLIPSDARTRHVRQRERFAETGGQRPMAQGIPDLRGVRKDGSEVPVEISLASMESRAGRVVVAAVRDMTERDQLEGQLRQAQKMESVGRLAAGVAHDFNNVLSVINTTAELASLATDEDSVREDLRVIRDAAEEASNLTGQLLTLSRRQVMRARLVDLNTVVKDAEPLVRRALQKRISLELRLADELPPVVVDPSLFHQVIMNLVVNARDAIEDTGTVTIETDTVVLDETYERTHVGVGTGPHVLLSVSDNGSGMDQATLHQIFEPFFTTKEPGKGTGLGMSTVYGIVKQVNGDIRAYSEPGFGTTFKIYVPVSYDAPEPTDDPRPRSDATDHTLAESEEDTRRVSVLVVDDDPNVLRSVRRILERAEYEVLTAEGPDEALRLLEATAFDGVDLLVSDVLMPGMNGQQLADRARERFPEMKVLFSSGYTGETVSQKGLLTAGFQLISKPYSVQEFLDRVEHVLRS